ncbi:unnamed protein product [Lampetra planeri]
MAEVGDVGGGNGPHQGRVNGARRRPSLPIVSLNIGGSGRAEGGFLAELPRSSEATLFVAPREIEYLCTCNRKAIPAYPYMYGR